MRRDAAKQRLERADQPFRQSATLETWQILDSLNLGTWHDHEYRMNRDVYRRFDREASEVSFNLKFLRNGTLLDFAPNSL